MGSFFSSVQRQFNSHGQGHVFTFWHQLSKEEREKLTSDLGKIDLTSINSVFLKATPISDTKPTYRPLPVRVQLSENKDQVLSLRKTGLEAIAGNKVAVILLAGGQGTRLGSTAPKGCYDIGLPSQKSLFQLQAERILRLQKLGEKYVIAAYDRYLDAIDKQIEAGNTSEALRLSKLLEEMGFETSTITGLEENRKPSTIPWYIMTSEATRSATEKFFIDHNFFGIDKDNVVFFNQGVLPAFTPDGKIVMESKHSISFAPNGNGGMYKALHEHGILEDMKKRGVEYVHTYCVDNCLVKVADPVFMGFCVEIGADCAAKCVPKEEPEETVGIICQEDDHYSLVEYSEMSDEMRNERNADGKLIYGTASIANLFFTVDYLSKAASFDLKYHVARKKIPSIDMKTGERTVVDGIKLEQFNVDVFQHAENFMCFEVPRLDEFAPLKNKSGKDCPDTCREAVVSQGKRYLEAVGAKVVEGVTVEISPIASYEGEGLEYMKGCVVGYDQIFQ